MSIRTNDGGVARGRGNFNPRMAALAALAGLAIGLVLVQAGPWRDDAVEAPAPAAVATAPARDAAPPEGVALTGGEGLYFTEQQVREARTRSTGQAPPFGTPALTGGEGEYFTE